MSEREDDHARREEQPYANAKGEGAEPGFADERESQVTIEKYEGPNTYGDLKSINLRKLAEGLVSIEKKIIGIENRMTTKDDLGRMATKHDLTEAKLAVIKWNATAVLAGIAIMAGVTIGILQLVLS